MVPDDRQYKTLRYDYLFPCPLCLLSRQDCMCAKDNYDEFTSIDKESDLFSIICNLKKEVNSNIKQPNSINFKRGNRNATFKKRYNPANLG